MATRQLLTVLGVCAAGALLSGCQLLGVAAASYERSVPHTVKAEYTGLEGQEFAVVVSADRFIQSEQPALVEFLTKRITERLSQGTNKPLAGGFVPADQVLRYLYDNPGWTSRSMVDLARGLGGVKRIVYIELSEFQLHEPGNRYEWDGVASGVMSVVELDSIAPENFAFQKNISVTFPDAKGYGPGEMAVSTVMTELALRFVDRSAWTMYEHPEMAEQKY